MQQPPVVLRGWLLAVALLLTACGGHGQATRPPAPSATPAPALPRATAPAVASELSGAAQSQPASEDAIRPAAFAGTWYPSDRDELARTIEELLASARPVDGAPIALIVPHAGYAFSGPVAAAGFAQLRNGDYDTAVIIAADHQEPISDPIAVWPDGAFETPLGAVPVNSDLAQALIAFDPRIKADRAAHQGEHAIEIELPFLQQACPSCSIVPILMGTDDDATIDTLAGALAKTLSGHRAVVIASSDLSHYPAYHDAVAIDGTTLSAIETGEPSAVRSAITRTMSTNIRQLATCACGEAPILVAMKAARDLGADTTTILRYANSGDSPQGDKNQVVGYGAVMFWHYTPANLSSRQQEELLALAREAIAAHLRGGADARTMTPDAALERRSGAFVTLKLNGELRGCIGHMEADQPLAQAIREMAVAAAFSDSRFPALTAEELDEIRLEISVLSPLHRITDISQIRLGTDGLMIYQSAQQGVLLPQVPVEQGWDLNQYLESLCSKAGLMPGCWRQGPVLYTFTAEVFGEDRP
jgi:AmmeMemoRadiSam system protein B/AmmeMemoRadiSam system protein A